jgi:hypothetical protein
MGGPQSRIGFDGLAVVSHRILVAVMKLQLMRNARIAFAIVRVDRLDLAYPRVGGAVRDQFDRGMDRHRVHGVVLESDRLVGLSRGLLAIVVSQSQIGQQFMRFCEPGIKLDRLQRVLGSLAIEALG